MASTPIPKLHEDEPTPAETAQAVDVEAADALRKAGVYYIWGPISEGSLKDIHQDVLFKSYLGPKKFNGAIQLVISSVGGDADEALSLIDLLSNVRFNVGTVGFGTCASAGAMLLACGTRGLRTAAPSCSVMIHSYSWGTAGNHHDLVAHRKPEDDQRERELRFWTKHSKYTSARDVEKHLLRHEDNWLTAKEAVKHGIVDRVGGVLR